MQHKDYNIEDWAKVPALLAASFTLTNNTQHINDLLNNLACHQSANRVFICQALCIICEILPFNNQYFQAAVEKNLKNRYGLDIVSLILLLNSDGNDEEKEKWLDEIRESDISEYNIYFFDFISGKPYTEDFFSKNIKRCKKLRNIYYS